MSATEKLFHPVNASLVLHVWINGQHQLNELAEGQALLSIGDLSEQSVESLTAILHANEIAEV